MSWWKGQLGYSEFRRVMNRRQRISCTDQLRNSQGRVNFSLPSSSPRAITSNDKLSPAFQISTNQPQKRPKYLESHKIHHVLRNNPHLPRPLRLGSQRSTPQYPPPQSRRTTKQHSPPRLLQRTTKALRRWHRPEFRWIRRSRLH